MWLKNLTPVGFVSAIVVNYGYDKLMDLLELDTAKDKLSRYASKGVSVVKNRLEGPQQQPIFTKEYGGGKKESSRIILTNSRQLQSKFKHALDFGIEGIQIIHGTYRNANNPVVFYLNPETGLNIISTASGQFISGAKLSSAQVNDILKKQFLCLLASDKIDPSDFETAFLQIRRDDSYLLSGLFNKKILKILDTFFLDLDEYNPEELFDSNDKFNINENELKKRALKHPEGHWAPLDEKIQVTENGVNNCLFDTVVAQVPSSERASSGITSGDKIRPLIAQEIETNPAITNKFLYQAEQLSYVNAATMMVGGSPLSTIADGLITADNGAMWLKNLTPVGFVSPIVVNYGYDKLMDLLELDTAKDKLSTFLQGFDSDLNKEQADILANVSVTFAKEAGRVLTHKYASKGVHAVKNRLGGPEKQLTFVKEYTGGKKEGLAKGIAQECRQLDCLERKIGKSSEFHRSESITKAAQSKVSDLTNAFKKQEGWGDIKPIKVYESPNGHKYILDGHHRFAAAKNAKIDIQYEIVSESQLNSYGYKSSYEVIAAATEQYRVSDVLRAVREKQIPKEGTIQGGKYYFHGIGCRIIYANKVLNYDYSLQGHVGGVSKHDIIDYLKSIGEMVGEKDIEKALENLVQSGLSKPKYQITLRSAPTVSLARAAIQALCYLKKKLHYDVVDGKIVPIDYANTGVFQQMTVWGDGLSQMLQMKEGLPLHPENISTNFLSIPDTLSSQAFTPLIAADGSEKGGNEIDYYNVGHYEVALGTDGNPLKDDHGNLQIFVVDKVIERPRVAGSANIFRFYQTNYSTLSMGHVPTENTSTGVSFVGLEPKGPFTHLREQNQRIPATTYNTRYHKWGKFKGVFNIYNTFTKDETKLSLGPPFVSDRTLYVPADRGILGHLGVNYDNTEGCILIGSSYKKSAPIFGKLRNPITDEVIINTKTKEAEKGPIIDPKTKKQRQDVIIERSPENLEKLHDGFKKSGLQNPGTDDEYYNAEIRIEEVYEEFGQVSKKSSYTLSIMLVLLSSYKTFQEADLSNKIRFNTYVDRGIFWNECHFRILESEGKERKKWIFLLFKALPTNFETFFKIMNGHEIGFIGDTLYSVGDTLEVSNPEPHPLINPWSKFKPTFKKVPTVSDLPREELSAHNKKYTEKLFNRIREQCIKEGEDLSTYNPIPYGLAIEFDDSSGALSEVKRIVPPELYYERMIAIGIGGFWNSHHKDLQLTLRRLMYQDIRLAVLTLEKYTDDEIASFFYFLFDGPHPEDKKLDYKEMCAYFTSSKNDRLLNLVRKAYKQSEIDVVKYFSGWFED
eukprot:gene5883-7323_t